MDQYDGAMDKLNSERDAQDEDRARAHAHAIGDHDLAPHEECISCFDLAEEEAECEGHPSGPCDPMGVTVYCDGTCRG
jgi:hypothetical protein